MAWAMPVDLTVVDGPPLEEGRTDLLKEVETAPTEDAAAGAVVKYYTDRGYDAVDVAVSDAQGRRVVEVWVLRFDTVGAVGGPPWTQQLVVRTMGDLPGQWVRRDLIENYLTELHRNPLHAAVPSLGMSDEGVEVLFDLSQSQGARYRAGWDDSGAEPLPRQRLWLQGEWADFGDQSSVLSARFSAAPQVSEFHAVDAKYDFYRGSETWTLNARYSGSQGVKVEAAEIDARSWQLGLALQRDLGEAGDWQRSLTAGLVYRDSNNALEFGSVGANGAAQAFVPTVTLELVRSDSTTNTIAAFSIASPLSAGGETLRAGLTDDAIILRSSLVQTHRWKNELQLRAAVGAQWASNGVLQADQIALGGAAGVRGLAEQSGLGDAGVIGSVELITPAVDIVDGWQWRGSVFLNGGATWDEVRRTQQEAVAAGLGWRVSSRGGLRGSLHAGWRLDGAGAELHSALVYKF